MVTEAGRGRSLTWVGGVRAGGWCCWGGLELGLGVSGLTGRLFVVCRTIFVTARDYSILDLLLGEMKKGWWFYVVTSYVEFAGGDAAVDT